MNYQELINYYSKKLKLNNISNAMLDCEILLSNVLKIRRENLILNLHDKIQNKDLLSFRKLIKQRQKKKPVAYLIKNKEFWKTNFKVSGDVLIPRPDTELIVEQCLTNLNKFRSYKVLDIGTGSGCILISILKERKKISGIGLDISKDAIKIAKINAKMQQLENRIKFIHSDIDNFLTYKYDLIVSNPPYIKKFDIKKLEEDVKNYEPILALDGGLDGLASIKKVIDSSKRLLKDKGKLILEIGKNQFNDVKKMLEKNYKILKVSKDLSGIYRCITSTKIK